MRRPASLRIAAAVFATGVLLTSLAAGPPDDTFGGAPDPHKVVGHERCAKCHQSEIDVWQETPHCQTFEKLHRTLEAKAIAKNLGLRSVKRNDECVRCHYTQKMKGERKRIIAGVSCESCHGAASGWIDQHADYGAPGIGPQQESLAHRRERRENSMAAGMNNPSNLYLIARQCLACHATPSEAIVNTGGHKPGSDAFDLVAWSQGAVRHNFQRGRREQPDTPPVNSPSPLVRVRVMHLVGLMADLEASLRAVSKATADGLYARSAAARAARAKQKLWEAQRKINHPLIGEALHAVATLSLTLQQRDAIAAAADQVGEVAFRFAAQENGESLAALDTLLPPPGIYK